MMKDDVASLFNLEKQQSLNHEPFYLVAVYDI